MQMDSKEGPWPFDIEEEWREALRYSYGVTMQEDGSMLISPPGQSRVLAELIGAFSLFLLLPDYPGYATVVFLMVQLRVRSIQLARSLRPPNFALAVAVLISLLFGW